MSKEALQIAEKTKEVKGNREKERDTHLNAEFQRIQGEIRKPFSVITAKKQRKIIKWERLEIASRNLEIPRDRDGNGNPLQYSCLENPMDGGAW